METEVFRNNSLTIVRNNLPVAVVSTDKPFIQANTEEISLREIKERHIIPVFVKDNEPLISHSDFIEVVQEVAIDIFQGEAILSPSIRLSHPVKGRIPDAKYKPAMELLEHEKTLYYERMAFIIELPNISSDIDGNRLSLTIGGVKAYNLDNLYNKKGADEHFKVFIGFQNKVCTNLCVWSDGYISDLRIRSIGHLRGAVRSLLEGYNQNFHLFSLRKLTEHCITEQQFANLIGRCRMYNHLPNDMKNDISPLLLGDTQIGAVVKDYYNDHSFCKDSSGNINLWRLYNLFTGTNKSSYIDTFLERSVNAYGFIEQLRHTLEHKETSWYLS